MIQLYSSTTSNGAKAAVMLEETGLAYEAHRVTLASGDIKTPEFRSLNPNARIPALIDPEGPNGAPVGVFDSGAILIYLAEKSGMLLPKDANRRIETYSWLMFQMSGIGPTFGKLGYFHKLAGREIEDPRPRQHFIDESRRLLGVLEGRLEGRQWIMDDDYTIADIATFPWIRQIGSHGYDAAEAVGLDQFPNIARWFDAAMARPASRRGVSIPAPPIP